MSNEPGDRAIDHMVELCGDKRREPERWEEPRGVWWLALFCIPIGLCMFGACQGCSVQFDGIGELAQDLQGDTDCTLQGTYMLTLHSLDLNCSAHTGEYTRLDDDPGTCSWKVNGRAGTVTCEPGNPVQHCEGETSRPYAGNDHEETCWFQATLERVAP